MAVAVFSLLFMQLALASYVCPLTTSGSAPLVVDMPDCEEMDMQQPALCHAHSHDQASKQSLDKPELPQVAAFIASNLVQTISALDFSAPEQPHATTSQPQLLAPAPDIGILHCCFRV